jgi:hypothetical protein
VGNERGTLHLHYAKIGIPAVAAAARYQRAKDPGLLPAVVEAQRRGDATA